MFWINIIIRNLWFDFTEQNNRFLAMLLILQYENLNQLAGKRTKILHVIEAKILARQFIRLH